MRVNAILAVLALNVALAVALALLWSDEARRRWAEPEALPPSLQEVAAAPAPETADVSRYRQTIERPLFAADRKRAPLRDPAQEAQAAVDTLKDVRLLGTYGTGQRGGIIVVSGGEVRRVAIGESIGGWKVVAGGEGRSAELARGSGERRKLELSLNSAVPTSAPLPGKAGAPAEEAQSPAPVPPQAPAAQPRAEAASPDATSADVAARDEQLRKERLARINQRRAARGLPPVGR